MQKETIIALDLEGTLISNAVSQFPRPGLFSFLEFCKERFEKVYIYTAVRDSVCHQIIYTLVVNGHAPDWLKDVPFIQWDRDLKDLNNIPNAQPTDCLIVDDYREYIIDEQISQWIKIEKFSSPYPNTDCELSRVQEVISERIAE